MQNEKRDGVLDEIFRRTTGWQVCKFVWPGTDPRKHYGQIMAWKNKFYRPNPEHMAKLELMLKMLVEAERAAVEQDRPAQLLSHLKKIS